MKSPSRRPRRRSIPDASSPATAWTDLGEGLRVRQSCAFRMNTLVLLDPRHTVIVDPGVLPSELDDLAATVADRRPAEVTLVFSHAHWDHVLGRPWWPRAATVAHARFAAELAAGEAKIGRAADALAATHGERYPRAFERFEPDRAVAGERPLELGPWRLVLRDAPGHAASQMTVHVPERRLLFAADMLSDIEIPGLEGPAEVYRRTLDSLYPLFEADQVEALVPGHGAIARGAADCILRLLSDSLYIIDLEARVRAARARGLSLEETQDALAGMTYAAGTEEYPMAPVHRENVRFAWEQLPGAA